MMNNNGGQINYQQLAQLISQQMKSSGMNGTIAGGSNGTLPSMSQFGNMGTTAGTGSGMAGILNGTSPVYQTLGLNSTTGTPNLSSAGISPSALQSSMNTNGYGINPNTGQMMSYANSAYDPGAMSTQQLMAGPNGPTGASDSSGSGGLMGWFGNLFGGGSGGSMPDVGDA